MKTPQMLLKYLPPLFIFMISYMVKEYKIEKGNFVVWDEAHFGKFSQAYLDRKFYFDVHPPLGKMLTALSGYIFKQTNTFKFTSSEKFPEEFDYVGMRRFHAMISSFVPFFIFLTFRQLNFSVRRSAVFTSLFIFENGITSISRLILLDSHMLAFTAATLYFLVRLFMSNYKRKGKQNILKTEWKELLMLGVAIGCVISVKWIGCLAMLFVGIFIIYDLYSKVLYCDIKEFGIILLKRIICLIVLPAIIYVGLFYLHFAIVSESSPDAAMMSSRFQLGLKNNPFKGLRKYISYGKLITIKSKRGYLHSHNSSYPNAVPNRSNEISYQVTTYGSKDSNNNFFFQKVTDGSGDLFLCNNDQVAIYHSETKSYLEAVESRAYFAEGLRVESRQGTPKSNSIWVIEIHDDCIGIENKVKAQSSSFYIKNLEYNCYLSAATTNYPTWGFKQGEVVCRFEKDPTCIFRVEENFHTDSEDNPLYTALKPSFISNFIEHNIQMFVTNKSFLLDDDLEPDRIVSFPYEWPILRRGLRMSQWGNGHKFYMFMNPFTLYCSTICLLLAPIIYIIQVILNKREFNKIANEKKLRLFNEEHILQSTLNEEHDFATEGLLHRISSHPNGNSINLKDKDESILNKRMGEAMKIRKTLQFEGFIIALGLLGWACHYLAFFFVGRVLYMHHYFPALFFALFNLCYCLKSLKFKYLCIFASVAFIVYALYSPLVYGLVDQNRMKPLKLFREWDFID